MKRRYNPLLISEAPLQCIPSLAVLLGSSDRAIMLQQIHYWLQRSNQIKDGHRWVYNSVHDWQKQFPWMKEKTVGRNLNYLENKGLLITGNYNRAKFDRTKWYRIDYDALDKFGESLDKTGEPLGLNVPTNSPLCPNATGHKWQMEQDIMTQPIPIDYQENNQKITSLDSSSSKSPQEGKEEEKKEKKIIINEFIKNVKRYNPQIDPIISGCEENGDPYPDDLDSIVKLVKRIRIEDLRRILRIYATTMHDNTVLKPYSYLLKMLREETRK